MHSQLEDARNKFEAMCDKQAAQIIELQAAKIEYQQASQHWEKQFHEVKNTLEDKSSQFINVQTENKVLLQQLQESKQSIKDQVDQNKLLGQDKWMLAQEKAHLEGQLKQMQKITIA